MELFKDLFKYEGKRGDGWTRDGLEELERLEQKRKWPTVLEDLEGLEDLENLEGLGGRRWGGLEEDSALECAGL